MATTEVLSGALSIKRDDAGWLDKIANRYGNTVIEEVVHKSVFTLTAQPLTFTDDAGVGQWAALKLLDFPAGNIITLGASADTTLTLNEAWWVDNITGSFGVGTTANADASTIATTRQNILQVTNISALTAQVGPMTGQSTGGVTTGVAAGTDADCVLNIKIADNAAHCPDSVTNGAFTGASTSWTLDTGWAYGTNKIDATTASTSLSQLAADLAVALVPGVSYSLVFTTTRTAGSVQASVGGTLGTSRSTAATFTETIVAGSTGILSFIGTGFSGSIDTVTCTPLTGSGNVTGTVTVVWLNAGDIA